MIFDYNVLSVWAAIIAALTAVAAIWVEGRRSRFSQGLDILISRGNQFNSAEFKETRRKVGRVLRKKIMKEKTTKRENEIFQSLSSEILDHFQGVGLLMRKGILDKDLTYSDYSYWVLRYWASLQFVIIEDRKAFPILWEDAEWLHDQFIVLEKKYRRIKILPEFTHEELIAFAEWESSLH